MRVDRDAVSPPDVQPPPLAAAIPGALLHVAAATAVPAPAPSPSPVLIQFTRDIDTLPVSKPVSLPSESRPVTIIEVAVTEYWVLTNSDGPAFGTGALSGEAKTNQERSPASAVCLVPGGADGRMMLYLSGPARPRPQLIATDAPLWSWISSLVSPRSRT
jgi:hypothetical protein